MTSKEAVRVRWIFVLIMLSVSLSLHADTYYVDSTRGKDTNSGTSKAAPWKTLQKINDTELRPGTRILLRSGSVWYGQLALRSSGAEGVPIVIGRYGRGPLPRIVGGSSVEDVVRLYNVEQVEIRDLEITNHGTAPALRRGVHVFLDNFGTAHHIVLSDLYIHDVNGTNERKENGGIIFQTNGDRVPSRFDDLVIQRNIIWKADRSGIAGDSYHAPRTRWFPSLHVIIRDNYVADIGGDGIVPWATDGALVEHNIARDCNRRSGDYNVGIWPWSTDNTLLRLNEVSFTRTTRDGEGFDSDFNSRNTVFEYNYSHDNEGGFMLICTPVERDQRENLGNTGTILRWNISRHDHERILNLSGADHTIVENNAFYVAPGDDVQFLISSWNGWSTDALFRQNRFYVEGTLRFGHSVNKSDDGRYTIAQGWSGARDIVFEGNQYIGKTIDRPNDAKAIVEAAVKGRKLNWKEPTFDPARPLQYSSYIAAHRKWMAHLFRQQFGKMPF
jgi:hypothetical protein